AADLEHVIDASAARERTHLALPVLVRDVVDGAESTELARARELRVARARDDRPRPGRRRELQAHDRHAARALEQHVVAGFELAALEERDPGRDADARQRRCLLEAQMLRNLDERLGAR